MVNIKYYSLSILWHLFVLAVLIINLQLSSSHPVLDAFQKKPDTIQAFAVYELPKKLSPQAKPIEQTKRETNPIISKASATQAISISPHQPAKKILSNPKDLLADLQKTTQTQKKQNAQKLKAQFAKQIREMNARSLQDQLLQENLRAQKIKASHVAGEVNKYQALILQAIGQHWLVPPTTNRKLVAELMIRLGPGGIVIDVQLSKSSGDTALDRSALTAVLKASPLPVPKEQEAFERFRQFVLKMKPENLLDTFVS